MMLNALLMCRDHQSLRLLAAGMDQLEIEKEVCPSVTDAVELLTQRYFSALVVDFELPAAVQVARLARMAPPRRRPVLFAMIGERTDVALAFQAGANFVLYKPLALAQLSRSLRAGRGFMQPDRRRSTRHKVEALVYLRFGDVCPMPAIVLDLHEQGLLVQAAEPLPAGELPLRFILPGTTHLIEGTGEVIWADDNGRAGIFPSELSSSSRKQLKNWMAKRSSKKPTARVSDRSKKARMPASSTY